MREHLKAIEPLINTKVEGLGKLRSMNRQDQETVARILIENKYVLDQLRERIGIMREREDALLPNAPRLPQPPASACCCRPCWPQPAESSVPSLRC